MAIDLEELEKEGWRRRFTASEPRLSEAVKIYRGLNLDVRLVAILDLCSAERKGGGRDDNGCTVCFEGDDDPDKYKVIFTRPAQGDGEDDGLF